MCCSVKVVLSMVQHLSDVFTQCENLQGAKHIPKIKHGELRIAAWNFQ